jgi:uncharacterized protein YeaO (DUF488 family)
LGQSKASEQQSVPNPQTVSGDVMIQLKRAYEPPSEQDGYRVLIDRIWPRGVKKEELAVDTWLKEIAPSSDLRRWFNHEPQKWQEFCTRYKAELKDRQDVIEFLKEQSKDGVLTLIFGAKEIRYNNAVALKHYLD